MNTGMSTDTIQVLDWKMPSAVISIDAPSVDKPSVVEFTDESNEWDYRLYTAGSHTPVLYGYGADIK